MTLPCGFGFRLLAQMLASYTDDYRHAERNYIRAALDRSCCPDAFRLECGRGGCISYCRKRDELP